MPFEIREFYNPKQVHIWTLYERKPIIPERENDLFTIQYLKASGDELEYLKKRFINIPFAVETTPCKWVASYAQFIFDNL